MEKKVKLYFYNAMAEPKEIDINNILIDHNHLGDISEEVKIAYDEIVSIYSLKEIEENQFLYNYNIWINPSKKMLQEYNNTKGLPTEAYLENFKADNQALQGEQEG